MGEDKHGEEGLSRAEFAKRGPEADPSQGAAAGPGAPETDEPVQGRDPAVKKRGAGDEDADDEGHGED